MIRKLIVGTKFTAYWVFTSALIILTTYALIWGTLLLVEAI